jgi:hypothetical protein
MKNTENGRCCFSRDVMREDALIYEQHLLIYEQQNVAAPVNCDGSAKDNPWKFPQCGS